jgi:hypothetical protein
MPKFLIERHIPGAGELTSEQLTAISQKSCSVIRSLGPDIQWINSFVTQDRIYCIYIAPSEEIIRRHAAEGGFPANVITRIEAIIDPTSAEA